MKNVAIAGNEGAIMRNKVTVVRNKVRIIRMSQFEDIKSLLWESHNCEQLWEIIRNYDI